MSSRSYRPPPGQGDAPRSVSSIKRASAWEGESDLFGHRPSAAPPPLSSRPASLPPAPRVSDHRATGEDGPPPSFSKGARDENSVLFSVKDLTNAAALRKSTAPPPTARSAEAFGHDPTGMVDLRAIAHTTQSSLEIKPLDIANLRPSVVPGPALQAQHVGSMWPSQDAPPTRLEGFVGLAKGPRAPLLFAGIGVVALLFVGFGAMLTAWAMSDSGGDLSASIAAAPAAVAQPDIIEREIVQRTKVAEAPEADGTSAPASARRSGRSGHTGSSKTSSSKSSSKGSSSKSSTPKKASDPCGCHGVLACAMRCTK